MADRPFLPDKSGAKRFCLAIGIGACALSVVEIVWPRGTVPTGNWSWLTRPLYDVFGSYGVAVLYMIVGLFLIVVAVRRE